MKISLLTKLEQLSFYNNKLTAIPEGVYDLVNLKEIDLYFNQIQRIDDRIGNLKKPRGTLSIKQPADQPA